MKKLVRWLPLFLVPLALAGGMAAWQAGEDGMLGQAGAHLEAGRLEQAAAALERFRRRPLLSAAGRRRGAALLFRLGEDRSAHALLRGQRFEAASAADARLRDAAGRCARAAKLLRRADEEKEPAERLRLARLARRELPDAPRVLARLAREELRAMLRSESDEPSPEFLAAYAELRRKAPSLADRQRREIEELARRAP